MLYVLILIVALGAESQMAVRTNPDGTPHVFVGKEACEKQLKIDEADIKKNPAAKEVNWSLKCVKKSEIE
jgi:hypothetical protein